MTTDHNLTTTYADLFDLPDGTPDPAFTQVIADLDTLAATGEPPTHVDAAIAQALRQRSSRRTTLNGTTASRVPHPASRLHRVSRVPTPSRPRQLLELAAACLAFALVTIALIAIFRSMSDDGSNAPAAVGDGTDAPTGQIAFVKRTSNSSDIYVVNPDGSNERELTDGVGSNTDPQWSPDGQSIVFTSSRDGNSDIFVMDADGSNQRNLTNSLDRERSPRWSPDGQRIAFSQDSDIGDTRLVVMNADGSNPNVLLSGQRGRGSIFTIEWSPDGSKLAYTQVSMRSSTLFVVNADGTGNTELSTTDAEGLTMNVSDPHWTLDGHRLVAVSTSFQGPRMPTEVPSPYGNFHGLVLIEANGSGYQVLVQAPEHSPSSVAVSPDGNHVAFVSVVRSNGVVHSVELYVANLDGSNVRLLATPDAESVVPTWSPDGRWLAFTAQDSNDSFSLYRIASDGSDLQQISGPHSGWADQPMWSAPIAQSAGDVSTPNPTPDSSAATPLRGMDAVEATWTAQAKADATMWQQLRSRPVISPTQASDGSCGQSEEFRLGQKPIYVQGENSHPDIDRSYSARAGSDGFALYKVVWYSSPDYDGAALVRGQQLDGSHPMRFMFGEVENWDSEELQLYSTFAVHESTERSWHGHIAIPTPGCYAMQFDGFDFSYTIVIHIPD